MRELVMSLAEVVLTVAVTVMIVVAVRWVMWYLEEE